MNFGEKWYVRNPAGKVFGPIAFETLQKWVRDGRVEPLAGISENLRDWMLAPLKPELAMDWIIENNPGQFYGPTHRAVVDDFVKSGTLSPGARFYFDDHGKTLKALNGLKIVEAGLRANLEKLQAEKTVVHAREWQTEVLEPEVVVSDVPPPPVARTAFNVTRVTHAGSGSPFSGADPAALAALERQAQVELARVKASGAKKFFKFGKKG